MLQLKRELLVSYLICFNGGNIGLILVWHEPSFILNACDDPLVLEESNQNQNDCRGTEIRRPLVVSSPLRHNMSILVPAKYRFDLVLANKPLRSQELNQKGSKLWDSLIYLAVSRYQLGYFDLMHFEFAAKGQLEKHSVL